MTCTPTLPPSMLGKLLCSQSRSVYTLCKSFSFIFWCLYCVCPAMGSFSALGGHSQEMTLVRRSDWFSCEMQFFTTNGNRSRRKVEVGVWRIKYSLCTFLCKLFLPSRWYCMCWILEKTMGIISIKAILWTPLHLAWKCVGFFLIGF